MKKIQLVIAASAVSVLLSGCIHLENLGKVEFPTFSKETTAVSQTAENTPASQITEPVVTETPQIQKASYEDRTVSVTVASGTETYYDPADGAELILTFSQDIPEIQMDANPQAESTINEYTATLGETFYTGNDYGLGTAYGRDVMLEIATDHYTYVRETGDNSGRMDMVASRNVTVERADAAIVSYLYKDYIFAGEENEAWSWKAINFSADTGSTIGFSELFANPAGALNAFLAAADDSSIAVDLTAAVAAGNWYLTTEGICVFQQPDAAGNARVVTATYDQLNTDLVPEYLTAERNGEGDVSTLALNSYTQESTAIHDRIVVDAEGQELVIAVRGKVFDISLSAVHYNNNAFYVDREIWYCNFLQDAGVQVCARLSEGMPNLMLRYESADGTEYVKYLTQSGVDGSIQLVDSTIEAVG